MLCLGDKNYAVPAKPQGTGAGAPVGGRAALSFLWSAPSGCSAPSPSPRSSRSRRLLLQGVAQHLARAELRQQARDA
eukprot:1702425-Prymnesium_polylepis.2